MKTHLVSRALLAAAVAFATRAYAFSEPTAGLSIETAACRPVFVVPETYFVNSYPQQLFATDVDGDGLPDLVALTYSGLNAVVVRLGLPDGTFGDPIASAASDYAYSAAIGRFTSDPAPGVVLAGSDGLQFLAGNGDGTFQPPVAVVGDAVLALQAADLDGDGNLDLVGLTAGSSSIMALLGNGDGTFQPEVTTFLKQTTTSVAIGDLDGDSVPDLVTAGGGNQLWIFHGLGDGRFEAVSPIAAGADLQSLSLADVNGDGHLDILAVASPYFVAVLLNNGDGTFQASRNYDTGGYSESLVPGDFDGDGVMDIEVMNSGFFALLRGLGDGTFDLGPEYEVPDGWSPVAADFGNRGMLDLAFTVPDARISVLRAEGGGLFRGVRRSPTGLVATASAAGDFDEDGAPDLALGDTASVAVFVNAGGIFTQKASYPLETNFYVVAIASGDWNSDGHLDLAFVGSGASGIRLLLGNGDGTFAAGTTIPTPDFFNCQKLVAADFDGDGIPDLAVIYRDGSSSSALATFLGDGNGGFAPASSTELEVNTALALLAGDWNEDGRADLAVAEPVDSNSLVILIGTGDGSFQPPVSYDAGYYPTSLATGDLRQSGHLDLVATQPSNGTIVVLPGAGDGTFGAPTLLGVGLSTSSVAVADFNLDGFADILTGSYNVRALFGAGGGAFQSPVEYPVGGVTTILTGDFDGDGLPDAVFPFDGVTTLSNGGLSARVGDASVLVGGAAVLQARSGGFGALAYQWRKNGAPLSDGGPISGSATATLTIDPAAFTDAASYDVLVTDACGTIASSPGALFVEFADVPVDNPFHADIITVATDGITAGCGGANYCPASLVRRDQMAVFLLKSEHGSAYLPPACAGLFTDVPCPSTYADWIEQLASEGVTSGCGGSNYCPANSVTRAQMAVFLLKTLLGSAYVPPAAIGLFADVPVGAFAADYIEDLYNRAITGGCSASPLLYCPDNPVNRAQMATFLVRTFAP